MQEDHAKRYSLKTRSARTLLYRVRSYLLAKEQNLRALLVVARRLSALYWMNFTLGFFNEIHRYLLKRYNNCSAALRQANILGGNIRNFKEQA